MSTTDRLEPLWKSATLAAGGAAFGWVGAWLVWNYIYGIGARVISDEEYATLGDAVFFWGAVAGAGSGFALSVLPRRWPEAGFFVVNPLAVFSGAVAGDASGWRGGLTWYFAPHAAVIGGCALYWVVRTTTGVGRMIRRKHDWLVLTGLGLVAVGGFAVVPVLEYCQGLADQAAGERFVRELEASAATEFPPGADGDGVYTWFKRRSMGFVDIGPTAAFPDSGFHRIPPEDYRGCTVGYTSVRLAGGPKVVRVFFFRGKGGRVVKHLVDMPADGG
jgi:hypothetical protein